MSDSCRKCKLIAERNQIAEFVKKLSFLIPNALSALEGTHGENKQSSEKVIA